MNDMPVFGPDQVSTKTALEDIAIETGTPIEVLFAAGEQAGAKSPDEFLNIARQRGQQLGPRFKAGEDPTAIVSEVFGPEAQRSFGAYATEIRAQLYGRPVEQPKPEGGFRKAVGVGVDTIQQGFGSAIEGAGRVAGLEGVEQYGRGVAERNEAEAQEGSRGFTRLDDVEGVSSFGRFASETAGQQVPQMGGTLAAAGAGALAGSFIPGVGTAAGAVIGGLAANIPLFYGQNRERQKDVAEEAGTPVQVDEGAAFLTSLPQAALDVVTDLVSVSGLGIGAKVLAEGGGLLTKRVLVGAGVGAGAGVLMEVPTEIGQSMLERLQAGLPLDTPDAVDEYIEVGVAAGLLGAGLGGVGGGAKAYRERDGIPEDPNAGSDQGAVPPGAGPASGPVPPVAPSPAPQGGPTPTADVLRPQPVDPLDPAGQRPAAPSPMSDVLAGAPQPTLGGFQQGQPVQMQFVDPETGEISDPTPMTFVGEDVAGGYASFRAPDGSPAEVDLAEIASGNVIVSPVGAMQAGSVAAPGGVTTQAPAPAPAQTQAAPMPPIPAGVDPDDFMERVAIRQADGMTPDQAYQITLQDALEGMREDVGTIAADVEERQRNERENASRIDEALFTDGRGQPVVFPTEAAALGRLGEGYTVEPFGGGFIGVRQQGAGNEGNANDSLGGDGGITDGGRVDADRGGDGGAPVATGRDSAALGPVEQGAAQGVADATGDADADAALTGAQGQPGSWIIREKASGEVVMETFDKKVVDALNTVKYEAVPAREYLAGLNTPADQNQINSEAATDQDVTPDQPEAAPADQENDPMRAAVRDAIAAGEVEYTTRKGKTLNGYVLKGIKPADVKAFDAGAFPYQGGTFVRKDRAEGYMGTEGRSLASGGSKPSLSVKSELLEQPVGSVLSYPKLFGDSEAAQALFSQNYESLSRDHQGVILSHVVASLDDEKVFRAVVQAIPVDVMDMLIGEKVSADSLAGDKAMLTSRLTVSGDVSVFKPVAAFVDALAAKAKGILADPVAKEVGLVRPSGANLSGDLGGAVGARANKGGQISDILGGDSEASLATKNSRLGANAIPSDAARSVDTTVGAVSGDYWHGMFLGSSGSVHVNASPAQKEAENYQVISADWRGLKLSLESPKGTVRRGYTEDGSVAWSVTMPAHYGRILRTEGADGDHVDFYMGDVPDSDYVLIINQVDPETQKMDEHKVIIGTTARGAALGIYRDGFSDGSGNSRIGSFTETNVASLKNWLAPGVIKKPSEPINMPFAARKAETKNPTPKPDAPKRLSVKKQQENRMAKLREYFTPGNIVQSYGGTDRVISFNPEDNGDWTVTVEAVKKQGDEWVKDSADTRVRTHSTNPDARNLEKGPIEKARAVESPAPDVAEDKPDRKKQKQAPRLLKRPFTTRIKNKTGGIDPDGPLGTELQSRGLTYRNSPGLFKIGGVKDLDNLPASEWQDYMGSMQQDGNGYISQQWIIDSLEAEARGEPVQDAEQERLQRALDAKAEEADVAERDADGVEQRQQGRAGDTDTAPTGPVQFIDEGDRIDAIWEEVRTFESEARIILSEDERSYVVAAVAMTGESVDDAFTRLLDAQNANGGTLNAGQQYTGDPIPWDETDGRRQAADSQGNPEASEVGDRRSDSDATSEGPSQEAPQDTQASGAAARSESDVTPAFEPGADGLPQAIMPGMEGGQDQTRAKMTERQRLEFEARKKQSKMRRLGGNDGDAGPLFGNGTDDMFGLSGGGLFDAPQPAAQSTATAETAAPKGDGGLFGALPSDAPSTEGMSDLEKIAARKDEFIQELTREVNRVEGLKWAAYQKTGRRSKSSASVSHEKLASMFDISNDGRSDLDYLIGSVTLGIGFDRKANYYDDVKRIVEAFLEARLPAPEATLNAQPAAPAPAPTATPDRNDEIEAALSKIATAGRGKKIADEFRAMLASERDDLADWEKTQKASKDVSIYDEDVARVEARIANIEGRILSEAESIKEPKGETKPAPAKQALSSLSKAEQDRGAFLRARIADRLKNQTNMGVDPAILQDAIELTGLYIKDGYRKFRALLDQVAADMGMAAKEAEPWVRAGYTQARDNLELDGADVSDMDDSAAVIAAVRALRAEPEGSDNVSTTGANLEPSGGARPGDGLGAEGFSPASTPDRSGAGGQGGRASGGGRGSDGNQRLPSNDAPSLGATGNSATGGAAANSGAGASQRGDGQRGDTDGEQGPDADSGAAAIAEASARDRSDLKGRLAAQKAADKARKPVVLADPDNIAETLPLLFESQHEDVLKAETRFSQENAYGMMFTNGTGTGKTFTGLGVVKRFALQGKDNILIVAPTQGIMSDWMKSAESLGLNVTALESTQDAGRGIVITTYANLGENVAVAKRNFDLVVADESHNLMSSADASLTAALKHFRAITNHPAGASDRAYMLEDEMHQEVLALRKEIEINRRSDDERGWQLAAQQEKEFDGLHKRFMAKINAHKERIAKQPRSNVVFLSATPFAYDKNIDYAEGYLFDYPRSENRGGYNVAEGRDAFMVQNFGYRMRYNKLTRPDGEVNTGVMERQFHERLKDSGALSARVLDVNADYSRAFALVEDANTQSMALGQQIDRAVDLLWSEGEGKYRDLHEFVTKRFDYLTRMRLLEAIKAEAAVDMIKADLALNRKIVVFHDYNSGGGIKIFEESEMTDNLREDYEAFRAENPWVEELDFSGMASPIETLAASFPGALFYNGTVSEKARENAKRLFNQDNSGYNIIVVQSAAGEKGISLHDTTGVHQRVLLNLGMPTKPTTAIQEEGRIYRVGQVTNAIFRYLNTGTDWERFTFAQRIAERASTAENLAMGEQARSLKESFIGAFGESEAVTPGDQEGTGGKARDRVDNTLSPFERAKTFYFAQQQRRGRRDQREGVDYYATPEPIGFKMVELADIKPGEKVLEPSAGHGAIARFFPENVNSTIVEPEMSLLSRAMLAQTNARSEQMRFEDLHVNNKYDAIVMNPPYGSGGKTAMEHVAKAMKHLRNGGRIVALIPEGPSADKRYEAMMEGADAKDFYEVAEVKLPTATFGRAGTSVKTRIVVIEKHTDAEVVKTLNHQWRDYDSAESVTELFDRIEDMSINARREPLTKDSDTEVYEARGKAVLDGHKVTYTPDAVKITSRLERPAFAAMAKEAEKHGGNYDRYDKAFSFPDMESRDNFLEAVRKGVKPPEPDASGRTTFNLAETTHAKKGIKLFVASPDTRVGPDEFARLKTLAGANGGYYSAFAKNGAIPGFQFEGEADRSRFLADAQPKAESMEMRGDTLSADPAFTEDASRAVTRRLVAEVAKVLPGTKVGVRLVRQLHSLKDEVPIKGQANPNGSIFVNESMVKDEAEAVGVLHHEIVHVLRNADLWRSDYGLFKRGEWERLVRQAESDKKLVEAVKEKYKGKGLTPEKMQEEYVAEMYRGWKAQTGDYGAVERILAKIEEFFRALASAFRGEGFDSAGRIMQRIADGGIGGRGPDGPGRGVRSGAMQAVPAEMRAGGNPDPIAYPSVVASLSKWWSRKPATSEAALNKKEGNFVSNLLTNAMATDDTYNTLGLVPGEVLFRDLGKNLPSAGQWVKTMRQMTSERQEMHAEADVLAREWQGAYVKDKVNGRKLHDLMHETTIEQVDPSERFRTPRRPADMTDAQYMNFVEERRAKHAELRQKFNALPENMRALYRKARDAYKDFDSKLIDAMVDAVVKAMDLQAVRLKARYEAELQQFKDDGLEGDALKEAQKKARSRFNQDVKMLEFSRNARIRKMRLTYEANRIEGPYFPLMRFGQFFVAARNDKGKLMHFERASTAGAMNRIEAEMKDAGFTVEKGVMKPEDNMSRFVDPNFVADITESLGEAGADSQILDAIYQRYLETLPSFSIRKANIHRQGVPGFDKDAIKAFGSRMFHGAHQLTRLRHSMDLTKHIENARREAKRDADPVRAGALVNEMQKRHEWSMNPQGASWSAWASSANFVWYLGLTPSAALMNLSQTTVVGIPVLTAGIEGATVAKTSAALLRAMKDFTAGLKKGDAEWSRGALTSGNLTADERSALQAAYNSGALDKSQAHDIAAIGDSGVEYSAVREKAMRPIAFLFHHAERLNREVTFLAAYRMSKEAGMDHDAAVVKAGDLTWDTHFNYENWSRPRFMQGDVARVIFTFKQFQVNMLYRLFRDSHQALKGETPEVRKQARAQLIGITASMMFHAGITGTWGYALIMLLAGMFFEGGSDEAEEELKDAIVSTFGAGAGGLLLKGAPGHLTGSDLSARMGMPELWFRSPSRQLEGADAHTHWVEQLLGPTAGITKSLFRGVDLIGDGEVWRGTELMVPKAIRDQLRFVRYLNEGVTTYKGDPLMDDISAHDAIVQAIGFSPARVSERYEQNRRLMNAQVRIEDERRKILADITRYIGEGKDISPRALRRRDEFNQKYPTFAITRETIQRSYKARQRMSEQMDGGVRINPKLDRYLRDNMAPSISQ